MKHKRAFTLIELMVIIAIIAILAGMGIANFSSAIRKSRDAKRKSDLSELSQALVMFRADWGSYPCTDFALTGVGTNLCPSNNAIKIESDSKLYYGEHIIESENPGGVDESGIYIRQLPEDTVHSTEPYTYQCLDPSALSATNVNRCVEFSLCTKLEEPATSGPNRTGLSHSSSTACNPGDANCDYFCLYSP